MFPNFANTKADLVCNGVLPIDQMREYVGPVGIVTRRIPKNFLDAIYGITIKMRPIEEGGTGVPTAEELLRAYAAARGYYTQGLGQPDESRAARYVLKDYVNGKLLYVEPPPGIEDAKAFNNELYTEYNLPEKRRAALVHEVDSLSLETDADAADMASDFVALPAGPKSQRIDKNFFANQRSGAHVSVPFYQQYTEQGKNLNGRKAKTLVALENGIDPKDVQVVTSKKHFKGNPRGGKGKRRGVNLSADGDDD